MRADLGRIDRGVLAPLSYTLRALHRHWPENTASGFQPDVDVLNVVVLIDFGKELVDFATLCLMFDLHRILRAPADAHRRDRPTTREQRLAHRVEVRRLGVETKAGLV